MTYAYARKNYINTQTHKNTFKQDRRYKLWNFKQCHSIIIVICKKKLIQWSYYKGLLVCICVVFWQTKRVFTISGWLSIRWAAGNRWYKQ